MRWYLAMTWLTAASSVIFSASCSKTNQVCRRTKTHALMSGSPAIDAGNILWVGLGPFDQRGSQFPRVSGSQADIGAHEVQQADVIFTGGFDGCP